MVCYFQFCPGHEARPNLTDDDIKRGTKKRENDERRKFYIRDKDAMQKKSGSVVGGITTAKIRNETMLAYLQCDRNVTDELKAKFLQFPTYFENY